MRKPNQDFYASLNKALETLPDTGTIDFDFLRPYKPYNLVEIDTMSYRLSRRGRVEHVHTLRMNCLFQHYEQGECEEKLVGLIRKMHNLDALFLYDLTRNACEQLLRCSGLAMLTQLELSCEYESAGSCIPAATIIDLKSTHKLEHLFIGYIDGTQVDGFVTALAQMTQLKHLELLMGSGTAVESCNVLLDCILAMKCLKVLFLRSPRSCYYKLSAASSLHRIQKILNIGIMKKLVLEDLTGLFEDSKCTAFEDFINALRRNNILTHQSLVGN
jgi:hypothetical protein